jgi:hypothetical protein
MNGMRQRASALRLCKAPAIQTPPASTAYAPNSATSQTTARSGNSKASRPKATVTRPRAAGIHHDRNRVSFT